MENQNVAPAGETTTPDVLKPEQEASEAPVALTLDEAVALEDEADRQSGRPRDGNGRFLSKDGNGEPRGEPEPQDDQPAEAEAGEEEEGQNEAFVDGNAETRLRDGRKVKIADLKKAYDEAEQIKRAVPEIQRYAEALAQQERLIAQKQQEFEQLVSQLQMPQNAIPAPPTMQMLQDDPITYLQQKEAYEAAVAVQQFQIQQQQEHLRKQAESRKVAMHDHMSKEAQALVKAAPELKNPEAATQFQRDYIETAKAYGFNEAEAANVFDHRLLLIMRDLVRLRRLESSGRQSLDSATRNRQARPAEAGTTARVPAGTQKAQNIESLRQRAKQTGSLEDVLRLENALSR